MINKVLGFILLKALFTISVNRVANSNKFVERKRKMQRTIPFLLMLLACCSNATQYQVNITNFNPTYIELCVYNLINPGATVQNLEIFTYNWDTNVENPQRQWYAMNLTNYDNRCWFYNVPQLNVYLIFLPASLRLTPSDGSPIVTFTDIITSLTYPMSYKVDTTDYIAPHDEPLVYYLTPNGNVSAYNAATTFFNPDAYACMIEPIPPVYVDMYAAIRQQDWANSKVCGQCLMLCNSSGYSVEVMVVDQCPKYEGSTVVNQCAHYHWLDISPLAFSLLSNANNGWGVQQLTWRFVQCTALSQATVNYAFSNWSMNYNFELRVQNYTLGLDKVEIQSQSSSDQVWIALNETTDNSWTYSQGVTLACPCNVRLTSIVGEVIVDEGGIPGDISTLPKRPNTIDGHVQFKLIPPAYQVDGGLCVPFNYNITSSTPVTSIATSRSVATGKSSIITAFALVLLSLLFAANIPY
jgi:hypothetical protein